MINLIKSSKLSVEKRCKTVEDVDVDDEMNGGHSEETAIEGQAADFPEGGSATVAP